MSLYAIGDLHLHFQTPLQAKAQRTERVWRDHEEKLRRNCAAMLTPEDTLVLAGDHSWGRDLNECAEDFAYIEALPGRKILLRGNHDMFWDANKTARLNEQFAGRLVFLQGNFYVYRDYALVGTKGYCFEGPFWIDRRGRIVDWDEKAQERSKKLVERELQRLRASFEAAREAGHRKYIVFLHYPPIYQKYRCEEILELLERYGVSLCCYGHIHGKGCFAAFNGWVGGTRFRLLSADAVDFTPVKLLD